LSTWIREDAHADRLVQRFEARQESRDAAWVYDDRRRLRELVFGGVRLRQRYDTLIADRARRGVRIRPVVRAVLWVALHEITELGTPPFAAVDQACRTVQELEGHRAVGFVNGLLRAITRAGIDEVFPSAAGDPLGHAERWLSHPRWLIDRWLEALGPEGMLDLCRWNNRRAAIAVRTPPGQRERVRDAWRTLGWESQPSPLARDGLRLVTRVPAPMLLARPEAPVTIQDEAAQLVAPLVVTPPNGRVLDVGAAPGGKLGHLAQLLPDARIEGLDVSRARMRRLRAQPGPATAAHVALVVADGRLLPFASGAFDAVLLDAPCTGTGVLARRHEARWRRRPEDLVTLPRLQFALLKAAIEAVRPGGTVVYSTCSLEPEENDAVVDRLLAERTDVVEIGVDEDAPSDVCDGGRLRVWPHLHHTDGAFAARLRRRISS
jgi:16S rRNA (cytosine967-C5)-methyltransferase